VRRLVIDVMDGEHTVSTLPPGSPIDPALLTDPGFVSITSTPEEISIVSPSALAPAGAEAEAGWRLLTVRGPLDFTLTGIMASLAGAIAAAGVPLFAVSTFHTDHILVHAPDLERTVTALREAGHEVHRPE